MSDADKRELPNKTYKISKAQLKALVEHAGPEAVSAALIQNGSTPEQFTNFNVSKRQLEHIIERAGSEAITKALIQNGSTPDEFTK